MIRIAGPNCRSLLLLLALSLSWLATRVCAVAAEGSDGPPYQATGFKVGEVTDTSAIVWARLTQRAERNGPDAPLPTLVSPPGTAQDGRRTKAPPHLSEDLHIAELRGAAPGAPGEVRVAYAAKDDDAWKFTEWAPVDAQREYTRQIPLQSLQPDTSYLLRVEARGKDAGAEGQKLEGRFRTAPPPDRAARVVFTVSTGQGYGSRDCADGYQIYSAILQLDPSFFVHTGDIVYYDYSGKQDDWAVTAELARYHWARTYSLPSNRRFHQQVSSYFIKDDHDTWQDDCWPAMKNNKMGAFTFAEGQAVFLEQVPMGDSTFRTCRWGKDLQVWLVEGRDFRSPNTAPDGPEKTIWGEPQKAWFKRTVADSDAAFRVLISPTPLVGPDRKNKRDNHSNASFAHEGDELRAFIAQQKNMVVVCGDRHWQYHSTDPRSSINEYSCGPVSDRHAGGWSNDQFVPEYHRFLKVAGGFLSGTVERIEDRPTLTFRFHDVQGAVRYEHRLAAD